MIKKQQLQKLAIEIEDLKSKLAAQEALLSDETQKNIAGYMFGESSLSSTGAAKFHMRESMGGGPFYVQNIARSGFNAGVLQGLALAFSTLENLGVVDKNSRSSKAGKEARALLADLEGVENYATLYETQREKYQTTLGNISDALQELAEELFSKESDGVITVSEDELDVLFDKVFAKFSGTLY